MDGSEPRASAPEDPEVGDVRDPLPVEVRDPSFSTSVRGYDRHEVDAYVERVNRLIAEMQISGSPPAAVRHALDRVGQQTSGILQQARESADEIIAGAAEDAAKATARARAEVAAIEEQRRAALVEVRRIAARLEALAADAEAEAHPGPPPPAPPPHHEGVNAEP